MNLIDALTPFIVFYCASIVLLIIGVIADYYRRLRKDKEDGDE